MRSVRVMTWNIRHARGSDGRVSMDRVAAVIERHDPDLVALQEIDVKRPRSHRVDQPRALADRLGMYALFGESGLRDGPDDVGRYGNALLSRRPVDPIRLHQLPQAARMRRSEPRSVLWGRTRLGNEAVDVDVLVTHLSVRSRERALQARDLVGERLLGAVKTPVTLLCADLNSGPRSLAYRLLRRHLRDGQRAARGHRPRATWPSRVPLLRLDHVLFRGPISVERASVLRGPQIWRASDHLPVCIDFALDTDGSLR